MNRLSEGTRVVGDCNRCQISHADFCQQDARGNRSHPIRTKIQNRRPTGKLRTLDVIQVKAFLGRLNQVQCFKINRFEVPRHAINRLDWWDRLTKMRGCFRRQCSSIADGPRPLSKQCGASANSSYNAAAGCPMPAVRWKAHPVISTDVGFICFNSCAFTNCSLLSVAGQ